jgi:CubicO group peptidase (beta-lactamase class C family)
MDSKSLAAWIDQRADEHLFSGVAMVWRHGAPTFSHAAGLAHRGLRVGVHAGTRFAVASISKVVTASTALRLVSTGVLDLHRPLVEVLPPEWQPTAMTAEHTLHHLLSHTSGLGNYHDHEATTWDSVTSCFDRIPTYHLRRPSDMVPLFVDAPPFFPPGTKYQYTDANFIIAALAIEAATGRPFAECADEEVFGPVGMTDTAFTQLDQQPADLATGYLVTDDPPETWRSNIYSIPAGGMPDGGMITTATDLALLFDAIEKGPRLPPELRTAMTSPQGPSSDEVDQYGYGCELAVEDGEVTAIAHGGSDPGVSCMVTHYRRADTTTVVLCNQDKGSWSVCQHIAELLDLNDPRT